MADRNVRPPFPHFVPLCLCAFAPFSPLIPNLRPWALLPPNSCFGVVRRQVNSRPNRSFYQLATWVKRLYVIDIVLLSYLINSKIYKP